MRNALLPRMAARLGGHSTDPSDRALLVRFVTDRDDDAFARLVARHGPMVYSVCRRVLGDTPDADDAFQAAFLVLVRKAAAVRDTERLTGWLYGVAFRTAMEARTLRTRRRQREGAELPDVARVDRRPDADLPGRIECELAKLPDEQRAAIALCDLDGRSRTEAATLLGIPEGTLSSRLHAGRQKLAARLARLGYGAAVLTTVADARAAVPTALLDITLTPTPSEQVQTITHGVLRAMSAKSKLWLSAVVVATLALAGSAVVLAGGEKPAATPAPVARPAAAAETDDGDDAGKKKVADAPPVVLKTVPAAGDDKVDPGIKELRVTFTKEMQDKSWSWATDLRYGKAIDSAEKIFFDKDKKTCVMPVTLEANTTYAVWINAGKFMGFTDTDGTPSVPYLLVFRTGAKPK